MIFPFYNEGAVKDKEDFYSKQSYLERQCVADMHRNGYAPVLDMTPDYDIREHETKPCYVYKVTVYGRKVPHHLDPEDFEGWLSNRLIGEK